MEGGLIVRISVMYGSRMQIPDSILTKPQVIGSILIMDGHGFLIIPGDGRHFTTGDGISMIGTDGHGSRVQNGVRDG